MIDAPHTSKEAALRLILGEMGPLLDRADAAAIIMKDGHALMEKDMTALGALMSRVEAVLQESSENATMLLQEQKALRAKPFGLGALQKPAPARTPPFPLTSMLACCVASAALALGGLTLFNGATIEQARVGRAVTRSLPYLDPATRNKLEAAIQKSNT